MTSVSDAERLAWLRLYRSERIGPVTFRQLLNRYETADRALDAIPELARRAGGKRSPRLADLRSIERELRAIEAAGATLLIAKDPRFSDWLKAAADGPPLLTVKGQIALLQKPSVALVGARNASANGRRFTEQIAGQLGTRDYVVVSGLARGIDTAAHRGSLASGTVAVLAGGLDIIYPPENAELYEEIALTGLIVAEMAMGSQPTARLFPNRNRIISGLSLGVVVVEAARRSGSLITARLAAEQGREVFAVPGSPLDPRAEGSNHLIREGAHLVTQASDVTDLLEGLPQRPIAEPEIESDLLDTRLTLSQDDIDQVRKRLWTLLGAEPVAIDELVRQCDASVNTVHAALVELELAGLILRYPNHGIARHYD